jgi:hypothetical protein
VARGIFTVDHPERNMRPTALLAALIGLAPISVDAQRATFVGTVTDSASGLPLQGTTVEVMEQQITTTTDSSGAFRLDGVAGGHFTIQVRRLGYTPGSLALELTVSRAVTVDLGTFSIAQSATELDLVVVEAERVNERLAQVGFLRRRQTETGTFLTHEDIEQLNPTQTSELLRRVPGFRVHVSGQVSSNRGVPSIRDGFSQCGVQYYVDDVHADGSDLNTIMPRAIAGMEIYTGSASIPPKYRVAGNPKCGVVLIWTRSGGRSP